MFWCCWGCTCVNFLIIIMFRNQRHHKLHSQFSEVTEIPTLETMHSTSIEKKQFTVMRNSMMSLCIVLII